MNRRGFLGIGAAAGGALVIGIDALGGCAFAPAGSALRRHEAATGELRPSAWLRILPDDRIIFSLDRVEMGQGTMTSHATLIAEELEVEPARIELELAEADPAYANPAFGFQLTGGSNSVATSWEPLRRAGAVARELLRRGAAASWGVPLAECAAEGGAIHHAASGRAARYGALVGAASRQAVDAVREVALKPPSKFRWIGTSVDRLDGRAKVDGSGVYGLDVKLPGLLTAVILRPPSRGATVKAVDDRAARARRGVLDVVTVPAGVAVIASSYWEARTAADLVVVSWAPGPLAGVSTPAMVTALERMTAAPGRAARDDGDVDGALAGAARTVDAVYALPFLAHATMEPPSATAWLHDGRCEVWAATQGPGLAQRLVADRLGLELADVAIHTTLIGGGFGRRIPQDYVLEAVDVSARVRRPVKVVWSREDDLGNDFYRPIAVSRLRGGLDARGAIVGWRHRLASPSILVGGVGDFIAGAAASAPRALRRLAGGIAARSLARGLIADASTAEGAAELPYAIGAIRVEVIQPELGVPVGFWRAVGHSHTALVTEAFLDELLAAGGQDPYLGRRALLAARPALRAVLDLAAAKAGWGAPLPAGVGRGIAVHESFGTRCAQVVEAVVRGGRVRVRRVVAAIDCGQVINPQLVVAQVEGAIIFGLSAALKQAITLQDGVVEQRNFGDYRALRMAECPVIEVHLMPSDAPPTGVGEPGLPPVAPALLGAIFAASGIRIRRLPIEPALREAAR